MLFFRHPKDIDLFIGGLAELPFGGGLVGKTFNCIIAEQFSALKKGDRLFFTHQGGSTSNGRRKRSVSSARDISDKGF